MDLKKTQVFTPTWVTNQVLDLLDQNSLSDENTYFFEPSCGNGEMLLVIIERLHVALLKKYNGDRERALADLCFKFYAIELDAELVVECRMRVFELLWSKLDDLNKDLFSSYLLARILHEKIEHKDFFEFMKTKEQRLKKE